MKKIKQGSIVLVTAFFAVLILLRLFIKLDAIGIIDFDEAKHAAEAYEMYQRNAWVAHTYYWEIDYFNSKPPLYYWLTNIFFRIFGVSMVSFKLPSVIAGAVLCAVMAVFLYRLLKKRFDGGMLPLMAIPLFMASFLTMDLAYKYHGFKTGNFDSVYMLFVLTALIFIVKAQADNRYLIPMGALLGLAFLSKGFNLTAFVFCCICSIPFLAKEKRIKYILYSILAAILVVLPWAVLRFRFDGIQFFYHMIFTEAEDKLVGGSLEYFQKMPGYLTFRLFFYGLVFCIVATAINKRSLKDTLRVFLSDLKEYALLWIWMWVPILFYSWAGYCNEWYIYPSYVIAALLFAIYFTIGAGRLSGAGKAVRIAGNVLACLLLAVTAVNGISEINDLNVYAGTGGGPAYPFRDDMREIKEQYGDEYQGSYVYMEDVSRYNSSDVKHEMFYDILAYAEYECDWIGVKGGIDAWEDAEEGILVINKDILDQYIDRLIGHVIIQDNGYIYFSHDTY